MEAVKRCTGHMTSLDAVPTQGMLDGDLLRMLLAQIPLPEAETGLLPDLIRTAIEFYLANCPDSLQEKLCPGVFPLLNELTKKKAVLALVTGNLSAIGWRKMELAGLRSYFQLGAFAEEGRTRADLVQVAVQKAKRLVLIGNRTRISLIGDHPNDIRAAAAQGGIQTVATATGLSTMSELLEEKPDILVNDLTELSVAQLV